MNLQRLQTIAKHLGATFLKSIGATNIQPSSSRSLRFDIAPGRGGINRVKVTETNGTATISFLQITEVELVSGVCPADIEKVIAAFTQHHAEPVPMSSVATLLAAFTKPAGK